MKRSFYTHVLLTVSALSFADTAKAEINDGAAEATNAQTAQYEFRVIEARLPDFIATLKVSSGARIEATPAVRGRMQRRHITGSMPEILSTIAAEYELDWFKFNGVYYVSQRREATSRVVRLGNLSVERAEAALLDAKLTSEALTSLATSNGDAIVLSGPPKLLAFAEVLIESIPELPAVVQPKEQIRVRRGIAVSNELIGKSRDALPAVQYHSHEEEEPAAAEGETNTDTETDDGDGA